MSMSTLRVFAFASTALCLILSMPHDAAGQARRERLSIAASMSAARFTGIDAVMEVYRRKNPRNKQATWIEPAYGLQVSMPLRKWFAVSGDAALFPKYWGAAGDVVYRGWGKVSAVAGGTFRAQVSRVRVHGTLGLGFMHFQRVPAIESENATVIVEVDNYPATYLAARLGGGVSFAFLRSFYVTAETSDLLVRHRPQGTNPETANPRFIRHNAMLGGSVGYAW
jgi:hypothetical protein